MWKQIAVITIGLAMIGCKSNEVKETKQWQPKKSASKVINKEYSNGNPCVTSKGSLDDFGPGVEDCRKQKANRLDDF